jgi:peptidyl-prolyl cis-trans isomerase C
MADKEVAEDSQKGQQMKSKTPVFVAAGVVAVLVIAGLFMLTGNGVADSEEAALSQIAPASSDNGQQTDENGAPMLKLGNPVVAIVNDEEIKRSDVFNFISGLPEQVRQMPIQSLFPLALDQVINNKVVSKQAVNANLEGDPEVEQLVTQAKNQIIRNVYVDRQIDEQITQKKLLKSYETLLNDIGEVQETRARHILIEDEAKANEVIALLDEGGDFETLAKEHSTGPSAERGGELGWFAKNEMVPEFSEAAFALEPGQYSKDPVKTQLPPVTVV